MLNLPKIAEVFVAPRIVLARRGDRNSMAVIAALHEQYGIAAEAWDEGNIPRQLTLGGFSPNEVVVVFDGRGNPDFDMLTRRRPDDIRRFPSWSHGAYWGVELRSGATTTRIGGQRDFNADRCARQLRATFFRQFPMRIGSGQYPWGMPRKGEAAPRMTVLPDMRGLMERLNSGPDFATAIASEGYALELPAGSRISWIRVPSDPVRCDGARLRAVIDAMGAFERACAEFARVHPDRETLLSGVHLNGDAGLRELYLDPPTDQFSVARPDLHVTESGVFASENDEMPGGFPSAYHLDLAYGVNQQRWARCFEWLFGSGPVLFLVSHEWSMPYVSEFEWFVGELSRRGYPARMATTRDLSGLALSGNCVEWLGERVGTIWRQFPIFETTGVLAQLVRLAKDGSVRMVPEWSHHGNKAWFASYWSHREWFCARLSATDVAILDEVLPHSALVLPGEGAAIHVNGRCWRDVRHLAFASREERENLVVKVSGANALSARSYGVRMGAELNDVEWSEWIDARLAQSEPCVVQRRLDASKVDIAVHNTARGAAEVFNCRVLMRPWVVGGEIVSVQGTAVPSNLTRVHGMVDMAMMAFDLDA